MMTCISSLLLILFFLKLFIGAELRETQKQINHLENPTNPQEVRLESECEVHIL